MTVGVDLGGTKVQLAVVDRRGRVLDRRRWPTRPERGPDAVIADVAAGVAELSRPAPDRTVVAVGVGVAGQVDAASGTVAYAPNLEWEAIPLAERLRDAVGLPVAVLNDVQAATLGEHEFGAGQGVADLVGLFVGTGIGGGVIAGGRLLRGCGGSAGELGHLSVELHGERCRCGGRGCVEAYAGGWALARRAREAVAADPSARSALLEAAGGEAAAITAGVVGAAARRGDPLARRLLVAAGGALAAAAASIVNAFNPCLLVLGGGVVEGIPELVEVVRAGIAERALGAPARAVRVARAALGRDAGSVGAAAWASGEFGWRPGRARLATDG